MKKLMNSLEAEGMSLEDYRARLGEQIMLSKVVNFEVKSNIVIKTGKSTNITRRTKISLAAKRNSGSDRYSLLCQKTIQKNHLWRPGHMKSSQRLNKGEDFSKLAGELSEDESRQFGGDLRIYQQRQRTERGRGCRFCIKNRGGKQAVLEPFRSAYYKA